MRDYLSGRRAGVNLLAVDDGGYLDDLAPLTVHL
jgi:hypothetical protein